jgi:hypothetical protein
MFARDCGTVHGGDRVVISGQVGNRLWQCGGDQGVLSGQVG